MYRFMKNATHIEHAAYHLSMAVRNLQQFPARTMNPWARSPKHPERDYNEMTNALIGITYSLQLTDEILDRINHQVRAWQVEDAHDLEGTPGRYFDFYTSTTSDGKSEQRVREITREEYIQKYGDPQDEDELEHIEQLERDEAEREAQAIEAQRYDDRTGPNHWSRPMSLSDI